MEKPVYCQRRDSRARFEVEPFVEDGFLYVRATPLQEMHLEVGETCLAWGMEPISLEVCEFGKRYRPVGDVASLALGPN